MRELKIEKQDLSSSDKLLIEKSIKGISWRYKDFSEEKITRLEHELNTIINMGFPDYFLIVQDFLDVGRRIGYMPDDRIIYLKEHCYEMTISEMNAYINEDQSHPGMTIGPGRGSAAGSIVAYLLGITSVEPVDNGLLFERFLNPERVSMPDIDSDLSKSEFEYGVRDIVIEYVTKKYGRNAICGITTPSTLAARAAVKNMARIAGSKKISEENYSKEEAERIKKDYLRYGDRINAVIPKDPNASFSMKMGDDTGSPTLLEVLHSTFQNEPDLIDIIDKAAKVEGLNINFGMHACGKIIYPGDIRNNSALMKDPKTGIWKLQMDAEEAEGMGLLKMDFLGLKNLNVITKTARLVEKNYGIRLDLYNLPEDPEVYKYVFAKGKTKSVFQFESDGMRSMLKRFEPSNFSDIILLVACYRPGPMQYLPDIIKRKHGNTDVADTAILHIPQINDIVGSTYMAIVYQEQVQQIFRTLAGYSLGQADLVRRAMGHKKMDVLVAEKNAFLFGDPERNISGCKQNGIDVNMADRLFDEMLDFAKYAFNKSHAAAYATIAYITAWLKYHYPTEFYISALEFTDIEKYPELIAEAADFNVKVHGPDIERSKRGFSGKNNSIYFGFSGIKGIGDSVESEGFDCVSFSDFILKTDLSASVIETLIESGAFDRKVKNRQALLAVLPDYYIQKDIIKKQKKEYAKCLEMIHDLDCGIELDRKKYAITTKSLPTKKKLDSKLETIQEKISFAESEIKQIVIPCTQVMDDVEKNLEKEKELIGMYASSHPLDPYGTPEDHQCIPISELEEPTDKYSSDTLFGKVVDYRQVTTKKTGEDMCFFKIMDQTGTIDACCFVKSYRMCGAEIKEGAVMKFRGRKSKKKREDEESFQFILDNHPNAAERVYDKKGKIYAALGGIESWISMQIELMRYAVISGHPLVLYDESTGAIYETNLRVSGELVRNPNFKAYIVG